MVAHEALMSGLVSACVGLLLRESRRWGAFVAVGMPSGTAFGVLVACVLDGVSFTLWSPLVALGAVGCAGVLVAFAASVFGEHRGLLGARPGSLLAELARARIGLITATVVAVGAWVTGQVGRPSLGGLAVVALAVLVSAAIVRGDRRRIRQLREVVAKSGVPVPHDVEALTSVDLGVGDERWLYRESPGDVPPADPYRGEARALRAAEGSLRLAARRARQVAVADAAQLGLSLVLLMHLALGVARAARELDAAPVLDSVATEPALEVLALFRTGSW